MKCSFCGEDFLGNGILFVTKTGKRFYFCSSKCDKNMLKNKRNPRNVKWTKFYEQEKGGRKGKKVVKREEEKEGIKEVKKAEEKKTGKGKKKEKSEEKKKRLRGKKEKRLRKRKRRKVKEKKK